MGAEIYIVYKRITMKYRLDRGGSHSVYVFVQVVKYRRDVFDNEEIIGFSEEKDKRDKRDLRSRGSITSNAIRITFHMIFKGKPILNIPKIHKRNKKL